MSENGFLDQLPELQQQLQQRGQACFDHQFYFQASHNDLGHLATTRHAAAWAFSHFITNGLREGRPYRFIC